jgi:hypothetical protein
MLPVPYLRWFGVVLVLDELGQIFIYGQDKGPIHWLYIQTLYRIPWVRKFNLKVEEFFMHRRWKVLGAMIVLCIILYLILDKLNG